MSEAGNVLRSTLLSNGVDPEGELNEAELNELIRVVHAAGGTVRAVSVVVFPAPDEDFGSGEEKARKEARKEDKADRKADSAHNKEVKAEAKAAEKAEHTFEPREVDPPQVVFSNESKDGGS